MKKGNLLIVDDEPVLLSSLKFNLSDCADEIYLAENGIRALELFKEREIHCILCDINMPVMNGVGLIRSVRELQSDIPFIFYTGHGNHELMLEAIRYGAFDFLNKPGLDNLEEVVSLGLKKGTGGENTNSDFMSEYKKLLLSLNSSES